MQKSVLEYSTAYCCARYGIYFPLSYQWIALAEFNAGSGFQPYLALQDFAISCITEACIEVSPLASPQSPF